jgi:hypothetical protein
MLSRKIRVFALFGSLALVGSIPSLCQAYNPCCCCPPIRVTACYQTIPVTEYRECRQTVQRPVVETTYVDQPCTEYKQVVENKTAEMPTCTYQNVTEMRTVQRDCGRWVTQCVQRPMVSPCEYDNRPDLFGFLNRTGYSVRMAFTPQSWTERVYVPNVVAQQVPVTRQVAVRGTQTINYQVAKLVPVTTTRRVAVNTVKMVSQEIVTQRPVTVFKTVAFGSSLASGVPANAPSTTTTALQPTSDAKTIAIQPKNSSNAAAPEKTAKRHSDLVDGEDDAFDRPEPGAGGSKPPKKTSVQPDHGSIKVPAATDGVIPAEATDGEEEIVTAQKPVFGRWVARRKTQAKSDEGPVFPEIANVGKKRK